MLAAGGTDRLAAEAWEAYRRIRQSVDARVARDLEATSGLSMADYEVLDSVTAEAAAEECVRVSRLAARMRWAHGRLSRQLGRMEQRGLIAREPCELDGRGDDVLLTAAGRETYEAATPGHRTSIRHHLTARLTENQLRALTEIADIIDAAGR